MWSAGGGGVYRIDTATNESMRVDIEATGPGGTETVGVGQGFGWVAHETKGELYKVDPRGDVVSTFRTGPGARSVSIEVSQGLGGQPRRWNGYRDRRNLR